MLSPTGYIPESLMYPSKLGEVMTFLEKEVATGAWKRDVFMGWARTVGVKISQSQKDAVYNSGWDHFQPPNQPVVP